MNLNYLKKYINRYKKVYFIAIAFIVLETIIDVVNPTIVNLLSGFYEIPSGEILIDGINIQDYKKDSLRR